jgi:hypothetical protein
MGLIEFKKFSQIRWVNFSNFTLTMNRRPKTLSAYASTTSTREVKVTTAGPAREVVREFLFLTFSKHVGSTRYREGVL